MPFAGELDRKVVFIDPESGEKHRRSCRVLSLRIGSRTTGAASVPDGVVTFKLRRDSLTKRIESRWRFCYPSEEINGTIYLSGRDGDDPESVLLTGTITDRSTELDAILGMPHTC